MVERATAKMPPISDVTDTSKIRVVIFINEQQVHVPLSALLKDVVADIAALDARITALENP